MSLFATRRSLRDYQQEAVAAVLAAWERGEKTLLILPTGTGKTVTAAEILRRYLEKEPTGRVLFLAHRNELIDQAINVIESQVGFRPEKEKAEQRADRSARIVVASIQTMQGGRLQSWPRGIFGVVVIDEAHHATSTSYKQVMEHFQGYRLMGMTATPDRADDKHLGEVFDSVAYQYSLVKAIEEKHLARIRGKKVSGFEIDLSRVRKVAGDLSLGDLEKVLEEYVAPVSQAIVEETRDLKTMVFLPTVSSAAMVAGALQSKGLAAVALSGGDAPGDRARVLSDFAIGKVSHLCNCLDERTEILTDAGWRGVDDIDQARHRSAALLGDGTIAWESIREVIRRPRDFGERMVRISNQTLDVRVTEGHRMLVRAPGAMRWAIVEAGSLPQRRGPYQLPVAGMASPVQAEAPPGSVRPAGLSLDQCRFIGLWIAEGSIDKRGGRGVTIGQSERFREANEEIRRILTACGFDWKQTSVMTTRSPHRQNVYRVPRGNIGGQLKRNGFHSLSCYLDKDLSMLLFGLSASQAVALVEGIWLGDGIKAKARKLRGGVRNSWHIVNTNLTMLTRLQLLAVTRGLAANLSKPRDNGPLATMPIYTIAIRRRQAVATNNRWVATSGGNPAKLEKIFVDERVWCIRNDSGTIITRRNGKVLAMGQCALFLEGFDEPTIEAIVMARPTQSRPLYAQAVGRGTRTIPGRKDSMLLVEFTYNSEAHELVDAFDIFAAHGFEEKVREQARKKAEGEYDVCSALQETSRYFHSFQRIIDKVRVRRGSLTLFDPFELANAFGQDLSGEFEVKWQGHTLTGGVTESQRIALQRYGVADAASLTKAQASVLIGALKAHKGGEKIVEKAHAAHVSGGAYTWQETRENGPPIDPSTGNRGRPSYAELATRMTAEKAQAVRQALAVVAPTGFQKARPDVASTMVEFAGRATLTFKQAAFGASVLIDHRDHVPANLWAAIFT